MDDAELQHLLRAGPPDEVTYSGDVLSRITAESGKTVRRGSVDHSLDEVDDPGALIEIGSNAPRRHRGRLLASVAVVTLLVAGLTVERVVRDPDVEPPVDSSVSTDVTSVVPPPSSVQRSVPESLVGRWTGASIGAGPSFSVLELRGTSVGLGTGTEARTQFDSVVQAAIGDTFRISSTGNGQGCDVADEGTYRWELSPGGTRLTLVAVDDQCSSRQIALEGTWQRIACRNVDGICLGPLEAGSVHSSEFDPLGTGDDAQLRFEVPSGWSNTTDFSTNYLLRPTADVDADPSLDGNETISGIYVWADVASTQEACAFNGEVGDPTDAASIADAMENHPGLTVTDRSTVPIGDRTALSLDLQLSASWTETCPFVPDGTGFAGVIAARPGAAIPFLWGIGVNEQMRVLLLDLGDGHTVAIVIDLAMSDGTFATFDDLVTAAMPIVTSFRFGES